MEKMSNILSGERMSFYKLFYKGKNEKPYKISIPIIQRDYAQGRKSTTEVRKKFLDTLYDYLEENTENRDLDFVYGSLNKNDKYIEFIPLDGQQRLTTLFLLHWYLWQISENTAKKEEFKSFLLKEGKSMFTYEIRTSSSEFCDALMRCDDIDFNHLLEEDKDSKGNIIKKNRLSKTIENSRWFFLSWKYDPTIKSMLVMLDDIHIKFANKKEYFERLIDTEKPIITFLFLNLEDFKLTDDLYIKMNSRGKQLTDFENFKAKFEQYLNDIPNPGKYYYENKETTVKKYFSHNIDTRWTYLFWNYKDQVEKREEEKNTYDDELNNFIRVIFTNQYAINVPITRKENIYKTDDNFEFLLETDPIKKAEGSADRISFYKYKELNALSKEGVYYLIDAFDALAPEDKIKKIKIHLTDSYKYYFDEEEVFKKALKHNFSNYSERIMFHAYIRFLIQNKGKTTGLDQWMRIIHNLSYNTDIESAVQAARAIKSIEEMLLNSNDIITYLKNNEITFFATQAYEEKIKAHLINKSDNWKNKIESTEKIDCFKGQIGFILEFSEIVKYYNENGNCNWPEDKNIDFFNSFNDYAEKAIAVFKDKDKYNKDYVWERAVLTKGDYLIEAPLPRKNLLSTNTKPFTWKRLFQIKNERDELNFAEKRKFILQVFKDTLFDKNNLHDSLEKILIKYSLEKKTKTWPDYLINCPELIKYCGKGLIRIMNKDDVILLGSTGMNHYHSEMYTHFLWFKFFKGKEDLFKPFKIEYSYAIGSKDTAGIILYNFYHNTIKYEIRIYFNGKFKIVFKKSEGENKPDNYGDDIEKILKNFHWDINESNYYSIYTDSDTLMEELNKLTKELRNL